MHFLVPNLVYHLVNILYKKRHKAISCVETFHAFTHIGQEKWHLKLISHACELIWCCYKKMLLQKNMTNLNLNKIATMKKRAKRPAKRIMNFYNISLSPHSPKMWRRYLNNKLFFFRKLVSCDDIWVYSIILYGWTWEIGKVYSCCSDTFNIHTTRYLLL